MTYNFFKATLLIFLFSSFVSCEKTFEPYQEPFDQNIVGEWISFYEKAPFPFPAISGFQITEGGESYPLSIETRTGKLVLSSNRSSGKYLSAYNGSLIYRSYGDGFALASTHKQYYKIKKDTLFLSVYYDVSSTITKPEYSYFLIRSNVGTQISQPVNTMFEAILDSVNIYNIPINPYPSSYSYFDSSNFIVSAKINNCGILYFELSNFTGIGNYDLNSAFASYSQGCGDAIAYVDTEIDSSTFTIEITSFDGSRVVGNFDLEFDQTHFRNGNFEIPVY